MIKVATFAYCTAAVIPPIEYANFLILRNAIDSSAIIKERERQRERSHKTNEHQPATDDCKKTLN